MNGTALATIQSEELDTIQRTGRLLANSGYFDGKGDTPQAIAMMATKILAGREMGFGPFASVNGVHIIQGRPAVGANLMAAAVKGSGRYDYRVREMTEKVCKIEFLQRTGDKWESLGISEFTAADAAKAQTKNMDKFPRNMLFARAMSNGVRFYTPDVFSGNAVYVPEELGADVDGDGNVIDVVARHVDTTTGEIVSNPFEDATAAPTEPHQSPPHQRLWGQGLSVFGDNWDKGARAWLIERWTEKATLTSGRKSASELTNDEKDMLADYIKTNAATLPAYYKKAVANATVTA